MTDDLLLDPSDPHQLATELAAPDATLVAVDFDGTLAPIVDHPDLALPVAGARAALAALARHTTVAVLSGRPVHDVRRRLEDLELIYAGGHGAEIVHPNGDRDSLVAPEQVAGTLDRAEAQVGALVDEEPGWFVERKDSSLAVHHRLAAHDSVAEHLPRVQAILEQLAAEPPGFTVLAGKAVVELRPAGVDKGAALAHIAAATPALLPLVIGDDVTDEDAFTLAIARGGTAVLVAEEPRPSAANRRLSDPEAVVAFLIAFAARA